VIAAGIDAYANPRVANLQGCVTDARTAVRVFRQQQGALFGKVVARTLTDAAATRGRIDHELAALQGAGKPGDYAVIFLSGHGGRGTSDWFFCPADYDPADRHGTAVAGDTLLATADGLAGRGLKVIVIVDACYSGVLGLRGKAQLGHHRDRAGGGILLMLSSGPGQTSQALGKYSAYAEAVAEALAGRADFNHDGKVTLSEARGYAYNRVHEMLRQHHISGAQDGVVAHSPSLSDGFVLAVAGRSAAVPVATADFPRTRTAAPAPSASTGPGSRTPAPTTRIAAGWR